MTEHSKLLPVTFEKAPMDKATLFGVVGSIYRGSTFICTVTNEAQAQLIIDSVNKVKRYEEALEEMLTIDRSLYECYDDVVHEMEEIAKNALKQEEGAEL